MVRIIGDVVHLVIPVLMVPLLTALPAILSALLQSVVLTGLIPGIAQVCMCPSLKAKLMRRFVGMLLVTPVEITITHISVVSHLHKFVAEIHPPV